MCVHKIKIYDLCMLYILISLSLVRGPILMCSKTIYLTLSTRPYQVAICSGVVLTASSVSMHDFSLPRLSHVRIATFLTLHEWDQFNVKQDFHALSLCHPLPRSFKVLCLPAIWCMIIIEQEWVRQFIPLFHFNCCSCLPNSHSSHVLSRIWSNKLCIKATRLRLFD